MNAMYPHSERKNKNKVNSLQWNASEKFVDQIKDLINYFRLDSVCENQPHLLVY